MAPYSSTPIVTDPYDRFMVDGFSDMEDIDISTGFLSFFADRGAGRTRFSETASVVDIDVRRGNKRIAALVPRGGITDFLDNANTEAARFTTFSRQFPLTVEIGNIEARQLDMRSFGEQPYTVGSKLARLRVLAMEHHEEQVRRTVRTWELLAAQAIRTGKMDAILGADAAGDTDNVYDFRRAASHTIAAANSWLNAATDIEADMVTSCNLVRSDAHLTADFALCGKNAIKGIMINTKFLARADNRRVYLVGFGNTPPVPPQLQFLVDNGFIYRGVVETAEGYNLSLFSYLDSYDNASGTDTPYLGDDVCIIGSSSARCDRYFGPPERLPPDPASVQEMQFYMGFDQMSNRMPPQASARGTVIPAGSFFFDAYKTARKTFSVEAQSAPIFAPVNTDAFVTLDVVP